MEKSEEAHQGMRCDTWSEDELECEVMDWYGRVHLHVNQDISACRGKINTVVTFRWEHLAGVVGAEVPHKAFDGTFVRCLLQVTEF